MIILLMVAVLAACLLIGVPIGFSIAAASIAAFVLEPGLSIELIADRTLLGMDSFVFISIPLFIFGGLLLAEGGIAQRLVDLGMLLVGRVRGGLGMGVVVASDMFSGLSGSDMADVAAISGTTIPSMNKAGFKPEQSVAIVGAAGAASNLVPPSNLMIILAGLANVSVAGLFLAGIFPALLLSALTMLLIWSLRVGDPAPRTTLAQKMRVGGGAIIPLMLPVLILGGIFTGIFTPTEASAVAVLFSVFVVFVVYRAAGLAKLWEITRSTIELTGAVMMVIGLASILSYLLAIERVPQVVGDFVDQAPGGHWMILGITALIFLTIGSLMEELPAVMIFVPIMLPISIAAGIDPYHFLLVVVASAGIGLFMPPFGAGLLVAASIGEVRVGAVARAMWPYLVVLLVGLVLLIAVPGFTTYLPSKL